MNQNSVRYTGDPVCKHTFIDFASDMDHNAWWCDICSRHELNADGIVYPTGAFIRTQNPAYGGSTTYAFRVRDDGDIKRLELHERVVRKETNGEIFLFREEQFLGVIRKPKHPTFVKGYETLERLAREVGRMEYGSIADLLGHLADDLERQAYGDLGRNRTKLADEGFRATNKLRGSLVNLKRAHEICEPFMKDQRTEIFYHLL